MYLKAPSEGETTDWPSREPCWSCKSILAGGGSSSARSGRSRDNNPRDSGADGVQGTASKLALMLAGVAQQSGVRSRPAVAWCPAGQWRVNALAASIPGAGAVGDDGAGRQETESSRSFASRLAAAWRPASARFPVGVWLWRIGRRLPGPGADGAGLGAGVAADRLQVACGWTWPIGRART